MKLTAEQKNTVAKIRIMATNELTEWSDVRTTMLKTLAIEKHPDLGAVSQLFFTADKLTAIVLEMIDINHHLAPQIIAIITSAILGITRGTGLAEVERLVNVIHSGEEPTSSMH